MDVICDTNIWYKIGSEEININEYGEFRLWATYLAIDELSRSDKLLYENRIIEVKSAFQQIIKNQRVILEPPFFYLLTEYIPNFQYKISTNDCRKLEFLKSIAEGKKITEEDKIIFRKHIDMKSDKLKLGSAFITEIISEYKQKGILKSLKKSGVNNDLILSIIKMLTNYNLPTSFDWNQIELFSKTLDYYFSKLIKSDMKIDKNDWYDLEILLYVRPEQKIWTMDKGLNALIRDAGLKNYIFEPNIS